MDPEVNWIDRVSLAISRVTMFLVVIIVCAITIEVVLRYLFARPTLWANELSLWLGGMSYLFAGLYAMQQRSHIRITALYEVVPVRVKFVFEIISVVCIVLFSLAVAIGGYKSASRALMTWERYGTAWDPPIPAVVKPLILVVALLVAVQAVNNLIKDLRRGTPEPSPPVVD